MKTIKALHNKGARELVVIKAADFRWLLAEARKTEPVTVEARVIISIPTSPAADWLMVVEEK